MGKTGLRTAHSASLAEPTRRWPLLTCDSASNHDKREVVGDEPVTDESVDHRVGDRLVSWDQVRTPPKLIVADHDTCGSLRTPS
jgi:hypothetical protein